MLKCCKRCKRSLHLHLCLESYASYFSFASLTMPSNRRSTDYIFHNTEVHLRLYYFVASDLDLWPWPEIASL